MFQAILELSGKSKVTHLSLFNSCSLLFTGVHTYRHLFYVKIK